jgi:dTDP-4-dehydrorhamnose 3,5-epimerase
LRHTVTRLDIPGLLRISARRATDARGYFMETYREAGFRQLGIEAAFVQDNEAMSLEPGTLRGLHFQAPPHAQAKLVRVLSGAIFDVAVDIRAGSPDFGRWVGVRLDAEHGEQLYIPAGFAHGYCTLEPRTVVAYKCDAYYDAPSEGGLLFSDPAIGIDWPMPLERMILSDKDRLLPTLAELRSPFEWEGA